MTSSRFRSHHFAAALLSFALCLCEVCFCVTPVGAQTRRAGALLGRVEDEAGASVTAAEIEITDAAGASRKTVTNQAGRFSVERLAPGAYTLRACAPGFDPFEIAVEVEAGRRRSYDITLGVRLGEERVEVTDRIDLDPAAAANANRVVLRDEQLDVLPEDARSRDALLSALVQPPIDLSGREIIVDGFTALRVPPKSSIREVKINQDPFAAEFERPGAGRIEILTKGGTDEFRTGGFFNFADAALNSRHPFAARRVPYRQQIYGANVSGPVTRRLAFFIDAERRATLENTVVSATRLDERLTPVAVRESVPTPDATFAVSPRFDLRLNRRHELIARYSYNSSLQENLGVGGFALRSRAYERSAAEHSLRLTESGRYGATGYNEVRFQIVARRDRQTGDGREPSLRVLDAFSGGGAQVGTAFTNEDRWELHDTATRVFERHILRFGVRARGVRVVEDTSQNFGGEYMFAGGTAPRLGADDSILRDPLTGAPLVGAISSLERYRRTLILAGLGFSPAEIRSRGGGATQFSIAGGNPAAQVGQQDVALYLQDEWRPRADVVLHAGLRYENQTNIESPFDFAPRVGLAWSPRSAGAKRADAPLMILRGGFGVFYERFGERFTLQDRRFNDPERQRQYVVTDPAILDSLPAAPSVASLTAFAVPQSPWRISDRVRAPYTLHAQASVERRLPGATTLAVTYSRTRSLRLLRSRNINAPLPGTYEADGRGVRPLGDVGNIFQFESSGRFDQNRLATNVDTRLAKRATLFASYVLSDASADTDGARSFPVDSYDLAGEYGRASTDIRHVFTFGGSLNAPLGLQLNPFVVASSGRPFNITTGYDRNGDTIFAERPGVAPDPSAEGVIQTPYGALDPDPASGAELIPRNYATGPAFLLANLRIGKTFRAARLARFVGSRLFGAARLAPDAAAKRRAPDVTFSVQLQNILNRTNLNVPSGNLRSPSFNVSNSIAGGYGYVDEPSAGNRRVEAQVRFSF